MTKTISSARCVVEFLKVMSTPLPTFALPPKQQDENENPVLPGMLSNCPAVASTPSLPSSSQSGATTSSKTSPTTSTCSSKIREAFVTPGNSPELVTSGHLRQLGRSLECTSVASPRYISNALLPLY